MEPQYEVTDLRVQLDDARTQLAAVLKALQECEREIEAAIEQNANLDSQALLATVRFILRFAEGER
jgi:phage shock protein A